MFDPNSRVGLSGVAALPDSRDALLGPSAQRLDVGLLAARTAAVLRRIVAGIEIDEIDRQVLEAAADMIGAAADAVEVVAGGGTLKRARGSLGFGAMAFTVELAAPEVAPEELPRFLRGIVEALNGLKSDAASENAAELLPAFSMLADVATRQAGTVGEGGSSLF